MRRTAVLAATLLGLAACGGGGDDDGTAPDGDVGPRCEPPRSDLPATGRFIDPLAMPLPADCVVGGLRDFPGRWFIGRRELSFNYGYPRFEGDCTTGFRTPGLVEDHDPSDGETTYLWSDGTRYFERQEYMFDPGGGEPPFEYVFAQTYCVRPDGTLAAVLSAYDSDFGEQTLDMPGVRFAWKEPEVASGLALLGELREGLPTMKGPPGPSEIHGFNVAVEGTHAYVVGTGGFHIVDVSDPAQPVARGFVDGPYNDVKVVRGSGSVVAFVSPLGEAGTQVIDVTVPDAPEVLAEIPIFSHSVFVDTSTGSPRLFLATYTNEVPVFDVSDPRTPVMLGIARDPGPEAGIHDLFAEGDMIFVNNTTAGFTALDVSAGLASPAVERGRYVGNGYSHASWVGTAGGRRVALHGDEGMTPDGGALIKVLDGDPASAGYLTELGRYQSRPEVGIHNFQLVGDKVYIAYYQDGVRVVDLANPAQPEEVAHYNTWDVQNAPGGAFEGALGIRVVDGRIYVADRERGLLIMEEQPR
jgi:hypothetical protein